MANNTIPPPLGIPYTDKDGKVNLQWQAYFLSLSTFTFNAAPIDAQYWVSTANPSLTNDRNLGGLATGFVFITVGAGVAVPSTTLSGASLTGLNASNLSTGTVPDARFPATLPAVDGSLVTNLTGANMAGPNTYTPTLTGVANVTASTAYQCQYARSGSFVTVSGKVSIDPTTASTLTRLGLSLPVASNFAAEQNCGGTAACGDVASYSAAILGDASNDRAELKFLCGADVATRDWFFSFSYLVI